MSALPLNVPVIDLSGAWRLNSDALPNPLSIDIPGDVYSALLAHNVLPDPFYGDNELLWLPYGGYDWQIERTFAMDDEHYRSPRIMLDIAVVDTIADIYLNDKKIATSNSMFVPLCIDIKRHLQAGDNRIAIHFHSAEHAAQDYAQRLPYPIPYSQFPIQSPHRNLIRKVQCHGGWDWGPALMTAGVYWSIEIIPSLRYVVHTYHCDIYKRDSKWTVAVHIDIDVDGNADGTGGDTGGDTGDNGDVDSNDSDSIQIPISAAIDGGRTERICDIGSGRRQIALSVTVDNPRLWWPSGHGKQPHYTLSLTVGELQFERQIAFRTMDIENNSDDYGKSLRVIVNGRPITITGANWIPCDALPLRQTDEKITSLLESAHAAHINMLRVWGGGQYESDSFYRHCSRLGILVWQDFMFSCALYPAQPSFLQLVGEEACAQIKRLKDFPCIALWCGNNENIGALTWFPESVKDRDRYLIDYDRLNEGVLGNAVRTLDPQRVFWPSSPCGGPDDYSVNWHSDGNGDMHFWSVWHEGKSFDAYYSVIPRFCSEFGFQSLPSIQVARSFAPPEALNPTHPYLEHHQRHPRGNSIIIETISRYFRFPTTFENTVYLSQLQQGLAIQAAVEYWRFHSRRCAGMMYWQLNDLWPGASWSSIEYGGNWKLLHYMARRFYRPLHVAAFRNPNDGAVKCALYNSSPQAHDVSLSLTWYRGNGERIHSYRYAAHMDPQSTQSVKLDDAAAAICGDGTGGDTAGGDSASGDAILHMKLTDSRGQDMENLFLHAAPKSYSLPRAAITVTDIIPQPSLTPPSYVPNADTTYKLSIAASDIALYVSVSIGEQFGGMSDNAFFLHPDHPQSILCYVDSAVIHSADQLRDHLRIFDIAHSH